MLLAVVALKRTAGKEAPDESLLPKQTLKLVPKWMLPFLLYDAKRLDDSLALEDFRVFDDGAEQHINYFKKSTLPLEKVPTTWGYAPTNHGTWGFPLAGATKAFEGLLVTYLIGYVPPVLRAGECHDVEVVVASHDVHQSRNKYCAADRPEDFDEAMREGRNFRARMRAFADSEKRGSIKASARAFAFWSSRVLSLVNSSFAAGSPVPPASDLTYVVEVHDSKAPATVHIALQFVPPWEHWDPSCPEKEALHVLGLAYRQNHQVAGQFEVTYQCTAFHVKEDTHTLPNVWWLLKVPTRFDAQMELAPGDYDLRLVVSDGKKQFGRARVPLHVETFEGHQLAISDVVLSSSPRDATKAIDDAVIVSPEPVIPTPLVSKDVEFIPDIETHIRKHTRLPIYFEIYEPLLKRQATEVYMHFRLTDTKTGRVVMDPGRLSAARWASPGNPVISIGSSMSTDQLKKGHY
jgi:hypothetical protein